MRSLTIDNASPKAGALHQVDWRRWVRPLVLTALVALAYHRVLVAWARQLWTDPYYSHCFLVPCFCLWVIWSRRDKFKNVSLAPNWSGFILTVSSGGLLLLGVLGAENFLARISLLFLLAGMFIQFCGWRWFRRGLFPWAVLFLTIPLPRILFSQVTLPLQFLSSRLGGSLLSLAGVPNVREGNLIHLHSLTLDVAEACSGLRSIMSLVTLAVVYGYFFEFNRLQRLMLVLFAVPIAVAANALRITGTGLLGQYWGLEQSEGFLHSFSGVVIFVFSLVLLAIIGHALRWTSRICGRAAV